MDKLARRIASRWAFAQVAGDPQAQIPSEHLRRFAYAPSTLDFESLDEARDSVNIFLPKFVEILRKTMQDRYYVTASEGRGKLFYFISPRHPVDTFSLTLWVKDGKAYLDLGFTPYNLKGEPDYGKMKNERATAHPEMAGLAFMRLVRKILPAVLSR